MYLHNWEHRKHLSLQLCTTSTVKNTVDELMIFKRLEENREYIIAPSCGSTICKFSLEIKQVNEQIKDIALLYDVRLMYD